MGNFNHSWGSHFRVRCAAVPGDTSLDITICHAYLSQWARSIELVIGCIALWCPQLAVHSLKWNYDNSVDSHRPIIWQDGKVWQGRNQHRVLCCTHVWSIEFTTAWSWKEKLARSVKNPRMSWFIQAQQISKLTYGEVMIWTLSACSMKYSNIYCLPKILSLWQIIRQK